MPQAHQPVVQRFWNPLVPSIDVGSKPVAVKYFGQDLVLWRNASGAISALEDRCQHRTARLSAGWVDGDALVCAYHGRNYGIDGKCVKIPQQPEFRADLQLLWAGCQAQYPLRHRQGERDHRSGGTAALRRRLAA